VEPQRGHFISGMMDAFSAPLSAAGLEGFTAIESRFVMLLPATIPNILCLIITNDIVLLDY
jgi:hypothetical protein